MKTKNFLGAILSTYSKHLDIAPDNLMMIDYAATLVLAGVLDKLTDKPWGWLEGPPSSGKTEVIMRFAEWANPKDKEDKRVVYMDDLTEHGLISCYVDPKDPTADASALSILNNKSLVVKDCSSITTKDSKDTQKLFGDLTGIYDGTFTKFGGIRGKQSYSVKMSVLLCTTPLSDQIRKLTQSIGERFLSFEIDRMPKDVEDRINDVVLAINKSGSKSTWRKELDELVSVNMQEALEFADKNIMNFECSEGLVRKVAMLADFVARLRSTNRVGTATTPESGRRLGCQLIAFGVVRGLLCGRMELNDSDVALLQRIAYDTIPRPQKKFFLWLWQQPNAVNCSTAIRELGMSDKAITQMADQFRMSSLVEAGRDKEKSKTLKLTDHTRRIVKDCGFLRGSPVPAIETLKPRSGILE